MIRRKPLICVLLSIGAATLVYNVMATPKPHDLFERAVHVAPSSSVNIRHSYVNGPLVSRVIWIDFRIPSTQLKHLLAAGQYVGYNTPEKRRLANDFRTLNPPRWWKPKQVPSNYRVYARLRSSVSDDWATSTYLVIDPDRQEVYAVSYGN